MLKQNKPFFSFLLKFLLFYVVFTSIYMFYLNQYDASKFEVDWVTQKVSHHTVSLIQFFGGNSSVFPNEFESSMKIIFNNKYLGRIIEGCNGISIIVLFSAFVFAFSSGLKKTFWFIFLGIGVIYVLNIVRIALLIYALYYYPENEVLLHGTIFPLFIYGVVFLLWVLWITKFSDYVK